MSIKKTWFSYILWLIATGFSILFTYYSVINLTRCYNIFGYDQIGWQIGYTIGVVAVVVLACLLLRNLFNKIQLPKMNKWVVRSLHVFIFAGITVLFCYTRFYSFITGELHGDQMVCFYEMTRIGFMPEDLKALESVLGNVSLVPSIFENIYMDVLSTIFLFLGNKLELLDVVQLVFQVLSLFSLYLIGWNVQKGIYAWIPAFVYACSPLFSSMIGDFGPSNFWLCISLLGMVCIFLLQKVWKSKFITYIVTTVWGICICVFVFSAKFSVLFQNGPAFLVGNGFRLTTVIMYTELFIWAVILLLYCITFWFVKTDSVSLYVLPAALAAGLLLVLQFYENDVVFFLTILIGFWVALLGTESLRLIFAPKPRVLTGQCKEIPIALNTSGQKEDCVPEDTGVIRVSDILNVVNEEVKIEDKTSMIENVLPMPKKHVGRSFEYAFEPTEEMMHYDVEVENDDYDYE